MTTFDREQFLNYINFPFRFKGRVEEHVATNMLATIEFAPNLMEDEGQLSFVLNTALSPKGFSPIEVDHIQNWIMVNR